MKRSNSKQKALSAFKKLGAVVLITATLAMCFTACNQTGGGTPKPKPTPKPKHEVTFSVEGENGKLNAKADGVTETSTSPINVEEGKTVTFTATANSGYRVKGWTLDGKPVAEAGKNEKYQLTVTKTATVSVSFELSPVEGGAVLILSPDNLTSKVKAKTADSSLITVEGCEETTLKSDEKTELHAKGTLLILKGKITGLYCSSNKLIALGVQGLTDLETLDCYINKLTALSVQGLTSLQGLACWDNQLTSLNVQGCTALQGLDCSGNKLPELNVQGLTDLQRLNCYVNQLNAQAMTELLNALPTREAGDDAIAMLYTEEKNYTEGNCKDLTQLESLKKALEGAKKRNWTLKKVDVNGSPEDI